MSEKCSRNCIFPSEWLYNISAVCRDIFVSMCTAFGLFMMIKIDVLTALEMSKYVHAYICRHAHS